MLSSAIKLIFFYSSLSFTVCLCRLHKFIWSDFLLYSSISIFNIFASSSIYIHIRSKRFFFISVSIYRGTSMLNAMSLRCLIEYWPPIWSLSMCSDLVEWMGSKTFWLLEFQQSSQDIRSIDSLLLVVTEGILNESDSIERTIVATR